MKKEGLSVTLGTRGMDLDLVKKKFKKGCNSGVKPGKKSKIKLARSIKIGEPIFKIREIEENPLRRGTLKTQHTTKIVGIRIPKEMQDGKTFEIETETSIYIGKFI